LDIANKTGTPIYAAADGIVETASWNAGGYGYQVVINHGAGKQTRYAHMSAFAVKAGDSVTKGQSMLEVETNKAVMDVPAPDNAVIVSVTVKTGDKVKPGQVVVTYDSAAGGATAPVKAAAPAPAPDRR
jgi:murein DD-endopeptidase MepM/ murein hydrolase activator NlpD